MCQAKALSHAERVLAYTPGGGGFVETDDAQQRVDHRQRHAHGPGRNRQRLAAAPSRVLGRRVEQQPDAPARVRQVAIATAEHEGLPAVRLRESDKHSHRRGLAGAVGAEEAGDGSGLAAERDVGHDSSVSTALGQGVGGDHADTLAALAVMEGLGARRAAATIAALTASIETRPTHWRVSPMASPQYGLDGPISTGTRWKNVKAAISIHATTVATRAADRCLNASRTPAIRTAMRLEMCWGFVKVSTTPAVESMRRSSKTARLRVRSARRAPVSPSSSPERLFWVVMRLNIT